MVNTHTAMKLKQHIEPTDTSKNYVGECHKHVMTHDAVIDGRHMLNKPRDALNIRRRSTHIYMSPEHEHEIISKQIRSELDVSFVCCFDLSL